jgi:hypothetical protein
MVRVLMIVIRVAITWGVTFLPLKRNLILRFMKKVEHKKRCRMH